MKIIISLMGTTILLVLIYLFLVWQEKKSYEEKGDILIKKIELFEQNNNMLPSSIIDLGLQEEMNGGPFYKQTTDTSYIVYFNIGFDNSFTYQSNTNKWEWK